MLMKRKGTPTTTTLGTRKIIDQAISAIDPAPPMPPGNLGLFEVFLSMSLGRKNRLGWLLI
jgi:hypothetical protein